MPWVPLDTHYLRDPKVQHAASLTPFALSVFPAVLAQAKQVADGGKVEVTFRDLAHDLFLSTDEAEKALKALVSAGVLTCPQESAAAVTVKFPSWRRWNDNFRKANRRAIESEETA